MLQYADDLAVYASHDDMENVQRMVQSACAGLNPSVCVTLNVQRMSVVPKFRYLGVVFDKKTSMGRTRALHSAEHTRM
jgi:hypothetical protein